MASRQQAALRRPLYRARQFFGALRPHLSEAERREADGVLGESLASLFESMSLRDQRHCFDVYRLLSDGRCADPDVLRAALLHDAGKGRMAGPPLPLWHRVAYVLLAAVSPRLLERLAQRSGGLATLHFHAERGSALAEAMGAPPTVIGLIAHHEERGGSDERLRLLRAADDAC